jgi:cytochrome b involved in lipid metabolism
LAVTDEGDTMRKLGEISNEEFDKRVAQGEKLVILDALVIDVESFLNHHPGGRFLVDNNIGRDISKFFHGGYSMENVDRVHCYDHTNDARVMCLKLAVGRLRNPYEERKVFKQVGVDRYANMNKTTATYKWASEEPSKYTGIVAPCSLIDVSLIAKHYMIKVTSHSCIGLRTSPIGTFDHTLRGMKRHYTECFAMRKDIYENLMALSQNPHDGRAMEGIRMAIMNGNTKDLCLTLKNYKFPKGLSTLIDNDKLSRSHKYEIHGPCGKGLQIQNTGVHIVYCAGTGILVFIDIVAHLLLRLRMPELFDAYRVGPGTSFIDLDSFQLQLYTSFASKEEAIGMELIDDLKKLCVEKGYPNLFFHEERVKGMPRWDEPFFYQKFN